VDSSHEPTPRRARDGSDSQTNRMTEEQFSELLARAIWQGMRITMIGLALGVAPAVALTRVMKNLLFEVSPTDPATFALIALLLTGVALIASYIPARRATKVDPLRSLRHE
jgi:putative ABC transport system permease protein